MRFKILVISFLIFLIGLPLFYYFIISIGMVSSSGNFYRIKDFDMTLIKENKIKDSCDFQLLSTTNLIEASNQYGVSLKFKTEYYSLRSYLQPFSLMAAREPGRQGSEEKIKNIKVILRDSTTKINYDITNYIFKPRFKTFKNDSENLYFKNANVCIDGECWTGASVFESLSDFQNKFNIESYNLIGINLIFITQFFI